MDVMEICNKIEPNIFIEHIESGKYYVDKTDLIRELFIERQDRVQIFDRPRHFGKTFNLNTIEAFLKVNPDNPGDTSLQQKLFAGTRILRTKGLSKDDLEGFRKCRIMMGNCPVISLSMKEVKADDWYVYFRNSLAFMVVAVVRQFRFLMKSPKLNEDQKFTLNMMMDPEFMTANAGEKHLKNSIGYLCKCLYRHFDVFPVVLVDDYDVPFYRYGFEDYHEEFLKKRKLLNDFFKGFLNSEYLFKAVLVGTFSPQNLMLKNVLSHCPVNTILDHDDDVYSAAFGFTSGEMQEICEFYGSPWDHRFGDNFGAYHCGNVAVFCPDDAMTFCLENATLPSELNLKQHAQYVEYGYDGYPYLNELPWHLDAGTIDYITAILKPGGRMMIDLKVGVNYHDFHDRSIHALWSYLLHLGYLAYCPDNVPERHSLAAKKHVSVCIAGDMRIGHLKERLPKYFDQSPEIRFDIHQIIRRLNYKFDRKNGAEKAQELAIFLTSFSWTYISLFNACLEDPPKVTCFELIEGLLRRSGFTRMWRHLRYPINAHAWEPDITFRSKHGRNIIVLKLITADSFEQMDPLALEAVKRILNEKYCEQYLNVKGMQSVNIIAIALWNKQCLVRLKTLRHGFVYFDSDYQPTFKIDDGSGDQNKGS